MDQNIIYNRELVVSKARQCLPKEDINAVMEILDQYGIASHEKEVHRVQIGMLKLSENNIEKLRDEVATAKMDFRDVLAYAEFPEEMRRGLWRNDDQEECKAIRERDRQQYIDWLFAS